MSKLDRISRSVADFAKLLELSAARKWSVVAIDLGVDMTTATGRLVAGIIMQVAQWEREMTGERTSAALQAAKRNGVRLGRPSALPDAAAERLLALRAEGMPFSQIAATLNAEGICAALGGVWHTSTVAKTHARLTQPSNPTKEHAALTPSA